MPGFTRPCAPAVIRAGVRGLLFFLFFLLITAASVSLPGLSFAPLDRPSEIRHLRLRDPAIVQPSHGPPGRSPPGSPPRSTSGSAPAPLDPSGVDDVPD